MVCGIVQAAFLFEVKEPFFARSIQKPYKISRENPRDITEVVNLIFADIQCAFVINQNNKVILSVDTQ